MNPFVNESIGGTTSVPKKLDRNSTTGLSDSIIRVKILVNLYTSKHPLVNIENHLRLSQVFLIYGTWICCLLLFFGRVLDPKFFNDFLLILYVTTYLITTLCTVI